MQFHLTQFAPGGSVWFHFIFLFYNSSKGELTNQIRGLQQQYLLEVIMGVTQELRFWFPTREKKKKSPDQT